QRSDGVQSDCRSAARRGKSADGWAAPAGRALERWGRHVVRRGMRGRVCGFDAAVLPNRLPLYLSAPVLIFIGAYSYTKRFTAFAHFWLGASLMLAPIAAWIAVR